MLVVVNKLCHMCIKSCCECEADREVSSLTQESETKCQTVIVIVSAGLSTLYLSFVVDFTYNMIL